MSANFRQSRWQSGRINWIWNNAGLSAAEMECSTNGPGFREGLQREECPVKTSEGERDNGLRLVAVNGVNLPVRSYRFDDHGAPLHVFYCYNAANEVLQRQLAQIIRLGLIRLPPKSTSWRQTIASL
jgi:hypothetical protein